MVVPPGKRKLVAGGHTTTDPRRRGIPRRDPGGRDDNSKGCRCRCRCRRKTERKGSVRMTRPQGKGEVVLGGHSTRDLRRRGVPRQDTKRKNDDSRCRRRCHHRRRRRHCGRRIRCPRRCPRRRHRRLRCQTKQRRHTFVAPCTRTYSAVRLLNPTQAAPATAQMTPVVNRFDRPRRR